MKDIRSWKMERHGQEVWLTLGTCDPEFAKVLGTDVSPDGEERLWLDRRIHAAGDNPGDGFSLEGAFTTVVVLQ